MALRTLHIGVGGRGVWPISLFPQRDDVQVVGLCDIRPEPLAKARDALGLPESACWADWTVALRDCECDAVVVITPPDLHHEMCLAAVRAGRHVMVEKPFTKCLTEAWQVIAAAEAAGVKLTVCQQARYAPATRAAVDRLAVGDLGAPQFGLMTRFSRRPNVHHSGQDRHAYAWERGVHDLDTAWSLFGGTPQTVRAVGFNPPWSPYLGGAGMVATVEFSGGGVCSFNSCFMSWRDDNAFAIECAGGSLSLGGEAVLTPADGGAPITLPAVGYPGPEAQVVDDFVGWVNGGPEPVNGMHQNLWIVGTIEAICVAAEERRVVDIAELIEQRRAGAA